jgi:hypothetical protein
MGETADAPRALSIVFSELDPFDVSLRGTLGRVNAARRDAGLKPINMNGLLKKLLYDWLVQYQLTGSMDQPPIWMQAGAISQPAQPSDDGVAINFSSGLAQQFASLVDLDFE